MNSNLVLKDVLVIDVSQGIAGPSAGSTLARYGANVIKVEPKEGDWLRGKGPSVGGMNLNALPVNIGKRSIAIDLKNDQGKELFRSLARRADILIESSRPGAMQRLGFGYDDIRKINEKIIYTSISGFGQSGPWQAKGGIDVVMQAFTGLMNINRGSVDGQPHRVGFWVIDVVTGLYAAQSILAAFINRRLSGEGTWIDCNLLQSALALQTIPLLLESAGARGSEKLASSPLGTFPTRDGWINFGVSKDSQWPPFCKVIGRDDLGADPSLARAEQRCARDAEIKAIVSEVMERDTSEAWMQRLDEIGVLNERVNDYGDLFNHPQVTASNMLSWVPLGKDARVAVANPPGVTPLSSQATGLPAPFAGEHTYEILREFGYGDERIEELVECGAVSNGVGEPEAG